MPKGHGFLTTIKNPQPYGVRLAELAACAACVIDLRLAAILVENGVP